MTCKICHQDCQILQPQLYDDRYGYPGYFAVYQCPNCQFGELSPELTAEQTVQLYTNYYPRQAITPAAIQGAAVYQPTWQFKLVSWLKGTNNLSHYYITPKTKVLDIGCGDGSSLLEIQAQGAEAYGTEFDRNIETAATALKLQIHFGDVDTLPYPDHYFDYITMNQLIEHVSNPLQFLQTALLKLKPTGTMVLSTPNLMSLNRRLSQSRWINWHVPFHVNFFTKRSLRLLAKQANLEIVRLKTITPATWLTLQCINNYQPVNQAGTKNTAWSGKPANLTITQYLKQLGFTKAVILLSAHLLGYISIPVLRLIDFCGYGDSFLIILKPLTK